MKHINEYITEFQGWPDWDDADSIDCIDDAVKAIKADKTFQRTKSWSQFYWSNDNNKLSDYLLGLDKEIELDDKEYLIASLGLTGMLSKDCEGIEFIEPIKDKLSMYDDDFGSDDTSVTFCYDPWNYPKEFENYGKVDKKRGYFYVSSLDCEQGMFDKRAHGRIPKRGLMWVMSTDSGAFPGYWCRDEYAKDDMKDYCGFIEFRKGKLIG